MRPNNINKISNELKSLFSRRFEFTIKQVCLMWVHRPHMLLIPIIFRKQLSFDLHT